MTPVPYLVCSALLESWMEDAELDIEDASDHLGIEPEELQQVLDDGSTLTAARRALRRDS